MHILKKPSQKSQNSKFVYFFSFYKQDRTKIKIISAEDFLLLGQVLKKNNEIDTLKATVGLVLNGKFSSTPRPGLSWNPSFSPNGLGFQSPCLEG